MNTDIVTYTGKIFDLLNPEPEMVCIEDIAHALANQCRYTGHTREFYSVAQHCVLMAENPELLGDPLAKLLHDATETYIGDIARPWKKLLFVNIPKTKLINEHYESVREFEHKVQEVVGLALGVDLSHSTEVKTSDIRMTATEIRDLMPVISDLSIWGISLEDVNNPIRQTIVSWTAKYAEHRFLSAYKRLKMKESQDVK